MKLNSSLKHGCRFKCRINFEIQVTLTVFPLKCVISVGAQFPPLHSFLLPPFGSQCWGTYPTQAVLIRHLLQRGFSQVCTPYGAWGWGYRPEPGTCPAVTGRGCPDGFLLPRLLPCPSRFSSCPWKSTSAALRTLALFLRPLPVPAPLICPSPLGPLRKRVHLTQAWRAFLVVTLLKKKEKKMI